MRKLNVLLVTAVLLGIGTGWAQTNSFFITNFRGSLVLADGTTLPLSGSDLTPANEPGLLLISASNHTVSIVTVSGGVTNEVIAARRAAFTAGGKFNADLRGQFTPVATDLPAFDGGLQLTGKLSPSSSPNKVSGTIVGVWSQSPDATFKGTISASSKPPRGK